MPPFGLCFQLIHFQKKNHWLFRGVVLSVIHAYQMLVEEDMNLGFAELLFKILGVSVEFVAQPVLWTIGTLAGPKASFRTHAAWAPLVSQLPSHGPFSSGHMTPFFVDARPPDVRFMCVHVRRTADNFLDPALVRFLELELVLESETEPPAEAGTEPPAESATVQKATTAEAVQDEIGTAPPAAAAATCGHMLADGRWDDGPALSDS